ncbi:MAG: HAD family phosphatase [Chitinophagales bacterium]|nr:HAD family phosphatase [Chitinophagales bacterium]
MPNPYNLTNIRAIVFDIGNVLIDIDYPKTISHFQALATIDFKSIVSYHQQIDIFNQFEKGEVTIDEFVTTLKQYLRDDVTREQIIAAWNTMLVSYPERKIKLLHTLKEKGFQRYALSNINELHIAEMNSNVNALFGISAFSTLFDKAYYSNEIGFRKPEKELYEIVLNEIDLHPNEILFIDDKPENLAPAAALGINTFHLLQPNDLYELLPF